MKTRDKITAGERFHDQWMARKEKLEAFLDSEESPATKFLLQIAIGENDDKIVNTRKHLAASRREWEYEMDRESTEVNAHQQQIFSDAFTYLNKEPMAITEKMKALLDSIAKFEGTPEQLQERKNDVYFELKAHIQFIRTRYNKKA